MARIIPKGAANLTLWRSKLPQITFQVKEAEAHKAQKDFLEGQTFIHFMAFPTSEGIAGSNLFKCADLSGVTVETNTIQLLGI